MLIMDYLGMLIEHEKICKVCGKIKKWKYSSLKEIDAQRCPIGKELYRVACNEMDSRLEYLRA